ncbi:hypothetical protein [Streptomyces sp. CC224B]|uniref:hypothetical protein n=1 Tax=Streptomyces sp. CC224B TaxID=3044571 RepID=UPI0024A82588|nr:hypothetical protein [Streptomyces sp. CC224B]
MTAPDWRALRERLDAAPAPALYGRYTVLRPHRDDGNGWPPPYPARHDTRFAHRPPYQWRTETDGNLLLADEETAPRLEQPGPDFPDDDGFPWVFDPHPCRLVHCANSPLLADAEPLGPARRVLYGDREGAAGVWEIALRLHGPVPELRLTVDATAGILLDVRTPDGRYRERLVDLHFHALPEEHFRWSAQAEDKKRRQAAHAERLAQHGRTHRLPLPRWWPTPLGGHPELYDGDPDTGFLVVDLDVQPTTADRLRSALLVRRPLADPPYEGGHMRDPGLFVHRWRDEWWQWYLVLDGRPLTPKELGLTADSLREG